MSERLSTYGAFWLFYLREHGKPMTRAFHYIGSALAILALARGLSGDAWWLLAVPVAGYSFAWTSHALIEHNKPATFTYPWWSLLSDFRMFGLFLTGRLAPHLARAGVL